MELSEGELPRMTHRFAQAQGGDMKSGQFFPVACRPLCRTRRPRVHWSLLVIAGAARSLMVMLLTSKELDNPPGPPHQRLT